MPWTVQVNLDPGESDVVNIAASFTDATDFAATPFIFSARGRASEDLDTIYKRAGKALGLERFARQQNTKLAAEIEKRLNANVVEEDAKLPESPILTKVP
jgi:hypothetical protein